MKIHLLSRELAAVIPSVDGGPAWNGGVEKWRRYLAEHEAGRRHTLVALEDNEPVAYGSVIWTSGYGGFTAAGIPEISDLVVATAFRRNGVGTRVMEALERLAIKEGYSIVGLGVGLYADYGDAQRLYCRRGYIPDGCGLMTSDGAVAPGARVLVDDDLVIYLIKSLAR